MEQGLNKKTINVNNGLIVENESNVLENINYYLSRNSNTNNIVVRQAQEEISNLDGVQDNERYHITRSGGNVLPILDNSLRLSASNLSQNPIFGIKKLGNNYSITRVPALIELIFETDNLQFGYRFKVFGVESSRTVHVCNLTGKLVKFGFVHLNLGNNQGLIDRKYRFNLRFNNSGTRAIVVARNQGAGSNRSKTIDTENLNIFFNDGDTIGLNYENADNRGNTGNYCQVKLTIDVNARQESFGNFNLS